MDRRKNALALNLNLKKDGVPQTGAIAELV
jgi:hypothetical protein